MATAQNPAAPKIRRGVQPLRAGQGTSFIWRKLHSLLGIIPIGAFLLEHLLSNFEALKGPIAYGAAGQVPQLPAARPRPGVGLHLPAHPLSRRSTASTSGCAANPTSSTTPGPATGCTSPSATPASSPSSTSFSTSCASASWASASLKIPARPSHKVQHELANPWMLAVYVIAMIAICWHFAYGIWLFAAKWGITPGEMARKRFGYVCAALGVVLARHGPRQHLGLRRPASTRTRPTSCLWQLRSLVACTSSESWILASFRPARTG